VGTVLVSRGMMWVALMLNCLWAVCLIGSASLLAPAHGAIGLGLSFLIAYSVQGLGHLVYGIRMDRWLKARLSGAKAPVAEATGQVAEQSAEPAR